MGKIQLCRDLGLHIALADHRLQDVQNALHILLFQLLLVHELLDVHRAVLAVRLLRQQLAAVVQHAHAAGGQLRHAGSHQVDDAGNLRAVEQAPWVQIHNHRGRGLLLLPEKAILVGQRQVHAGILHGRQALDGARQLPFQRPLVVHPLLELGDTEFAVVHHLKPGNRAFGQALRSQFEPGIVHLVGGHQNRAAPFRIPVRHVHLRQLRHDGPGVLIRQAGEQHPVIRLARKQGRRNDGHHRQGRHTAPAQALATVHGLKTLLQRAQTSNR